MEAWAQAVGGWRREHPGRVMRIASSRTAGGTTESTAEWVSDNRYRRRVDEGTEHTELVYDGVHCWEKDWNGKVLELQGRDARDLTTVAALMSLLFDGPPADLVPVTRATWAGEDTTGTFDRIRFEPADGVPFTLLFDKVTSLPVQAVRRPYDEEIVLELDDWRADGGIVRPFQLRETSEDEVTSQVVGTITADPQAQQKLFARPAEGQPDYRFASGRSATAIPFNFENEHIMLECRVNDSEPIWFMLDTGANSTIINKPRLGDFGLESFGASSVNGGGGSTDFAFTRVAKLAVGGVELRDQRNGVIDLSGLEKVYGMPMGGILGYDFASRFVICVDYDTKTLDLIEPADYTYRGDGERVPLVFEGHHPHVQSEITVAEGAPIAADFVIDSGAAATANLTSPFVREHGLLDRARKRPAGQARTLAGSEGQFFAQTSVRGKLDGLTLGRLRLEGVPVNLQLGTRGAYSSASFSGTIGEGILSRFTTIYDYSRQVLILEPNAAAATPFPPRTTFGVTFLAEGPDYTVFRVTGVRKDSPASRAGLEKGDIVEALDDTPASRLRLADLRQALSVDGSEHVLEVLRGTEERLRLPFTVERVSIEDD
jgi:Aspartyl protease/PDZ domain